jgi:hypothetical protein
MSQIPQPPRDDVLPWFLQNPQVPAETVGAVNKLLRVRVVVRTAGTSSLLISDSEAVLTISTKDVDLGTITGSKAGNAALTNLLGALRRVFTLTDTTS